MGLGLERVETDSHVRKKADLLSKLRINITQLIQSTLSLSRCNHRRTHRHLYTLKPKHVIKLNLETLTFNVKETFCVLQVKLCDCVTVAPLCCHRPQLHFKAFGFKSSLAKQPSTATSRLRFSIKETAYDGWLKVCPFAFPVGIIFGTCLFLLSNVFYWLFKGGYTLRGCVKHCAVEWPFESLLLRVQNREFMPRFARQPCGL